MSIRTRCTARRVLGAEPPPLAPSRLSNAFSRADRPRSPYFSVLACTSLGPSRKRGPPKGYIDAIEARLHQTEAIVGILLAADDIRARSLLDDLAEVGLSSITFPAPS